MKKEEIFACFLVQLAPRHSCPHAGHWRRLRRHCDRGGPRKQGGQLVSCNKRPAGDCAELSRTRRSSSAKEIVCLPSRTERCHQRTHEARRRHRCRHHHRRAGRSPPHQLDTTTGKNWPPPGLVDPCPRPAGCYAEYVMLKEAWVAHAPPEDVISLVHAAGVPLVAITAAQALEKASPKAGQRILILGASGAMPPPAPPCNHAAVLHPAPPTTAFTKPRPPPPPRQ